MIKIDKTTLDAVKLCAVSVGISPTSFMQGAIIAAIETCCERDSTLRFAVEQAGYELNDMCGDCHAIYT